ncbi:MAG: hypothetical protein AVDCRST_MAG22-111 [uncultured Rubrobacteraceae bacterium]|uniref:Uncharacterized protein n=1 Tax=uncultured Rubrobacteraceae bacterium TaxID=349277 RepID=A0A6J4NB26_9ACTN|nr:MAG: hypothetical protein AVDCRST_MAG22-111 [uncultured Rubrobacteraceae bacterium]
MMFPSQDDLETNGSTLVRQRAFGLRERTSERADPAGFELATHGPGNLPRYLVIEQ